MEAIVLQHLTIARIAEGFNVASDAAHDAVLAEGKHALIDDPARFDGVTTIGVDEHVGRHTRRGDKYVTVIADLTPIREKTGPARLLDMVEGRSKAMFKSWLANRPDHWRDRVEVVAMDEFIGFKTAASEELPKAVPVEIRKLGRTPKQRTADVLAFFDRPGTSNGPTEAINGRLDYLRGSTLGFRNLAHYIARSLLECGFRPRIHL